MSRANLGPLSGLVGTWESDGGKDVAPSDERGVANSEYRERTIFEETGLVDNHEQLLYGLRYQNTAWRLGRDKPFHMEMGFWMWDEAEKQVMKCFTIPRGVSVLAGGSSEADARSFSVYAELGSEVYGICSNRFLNEEFQTVKYELNVELVDENTFSYSSDTLLKMNGKEELFHHTDQNLMKRVEAR